MCAVKPFNITQVSNWNLVLVKISFKKIIIVNKKIIIELAKEDKSIWVRQTRLQLFTEKNLLLQNTVISTTCWNVLGSGTILSVSETEKVNTVQ